jgi:hypothetical protein
MRIKPSHRWFGVALLAALAGLITAGLAGATPFSNPAAITINDGGLCDNVSNLALTPGKATAYPSSNTVSGLTGVISDVNVTLTGLTHNFPDDVDVLLLSPTGRPLS